MFEVLADVPRSASHYPDVAAVHEVSEGVYRWELKKLGTAGINHQVIYACRYVSDAEAGEIRWTPVEGVGNAIIAGSWQLSEGAAGTEIGFQNEGTLSIPIPRLLKSVAVPFIQASFRTQIERYIQNLTQTFTD